MCRFLSFVCSPALLLDWFLGIGRVLLRARAIHHRGLCCRLRACALQDGRALLRHGTEGGAQHLTCVCSNGQHTALSVQQAHGNAGISGVLSVRIVEGNGFPRVGRVSTVLEIAGPLIKVTAGCILAFSLRQNLFGRATIARVWSSAGPEPSLGEGRQRPDRSLGAKDHLKKDSILPFCVFARHPKVVSRTAKRRGFIHYTS